MGRVPLRDGLCSTGDLKWVSTIKELVTLLPTGRRRRRLSHDHHKHELIYRLFSCDGHRLISRIFNKKMSLTNNFVVDLISPKCMSGCCPNLFLFLSSALLSTLLLFTPCSSSGDFSCCQSLSPSCLVSQSLSRCWKIDLLS